MIVPIYVPYGQPSDTDYIYPDWVEIYMGISIALMLIAMVGFLIVMALTVITDQFFDTALAVSLVIGVIGAILLVVGIFIMAVTGVPVNEIS